MDNNNNLLGNLKKNLTAMTPFGTENMLNNANSFFSSNTVIAKAIHLMES